jgi:hypothetical protein
MSSLSSVEKRRLSAFLRMDNGYVLDFDNMTFGEFFRGEAGVDIYSDKYASYGTSKAKRMRAFWELEPDQLVGKVLNALIDNDLASAPDTVPVDYPVQVDRCRAIAQRLMAAGTNLELLKGSVVLGNAVHLAEQIRRIEQAIDTDPALAVGTAKELVEAVCKTILAERGKPVDGTPDFPALTKMTALELRLVPDSVPKAAKGAETIRRLLGNLGTVAQGLAELRNLYGTGHGKHGATQPIKPRHARLAVGAAATLATFLYETHKEST